MAENGWGKQEQMQMKQFTLLLTSQPAASESNCSTFRICFFKDFSKWLPSPNTILAPFYTFYQRI